MNRRVKKAGRYDDTTKRARAGSFGSVVTGARWRIGASAHRRISLPDLLSVIERCLRHPSTSADKKSLLPISQPMRPRDILLSGVRKSCRRWFLQVFSPSRSIGTPEPVSKGLSGGQYEMGGRGEGWGRVVRMG